MSNLSPYITLKYVRCLCFVKDRVPTHQKSNVIYTIKCPGYGEDYVGKTDRCVITRLNEHSNRSDQPKFQCFQHCEKFLETMTLYQLPDILYQLPVLSAYKAILLAQFLIIGRS